MPLARDSPSIQGDVPGPDPARAPPNKAIAQAGLACRGSRRGSPLPAKVRDVERRCPRKRAGLVHVWSTRHRNRAVPNGLQRYIVRASHALTASQPSDSGVCATLISDTSSDACWALFGGGVAAVAETYFGQFTYGSTGAGDGSK